jgi:hypothetical protein
MGCDFFFNGKLPSPELQEKVIRFWTSNLREPPWRVVSPYALPPVTTLFRGGLGIHDHVIFLGSPQPFQLYGVIPFSTMDGSLDDQGQVVFDRSRQGTLVRIHRLPPAFGLKANEHAMDEANLQALIRSGRVQWAGGGAPRNDVDIEEGGYLRLLDDEMSWALRLNIIRLRWWPDLYHGDDAELCRYVADALAGNPTLASSLQDESLDFLACERLFMAVRPKHPLEDIDLSDLTDGTEDEEYMRLAREVEERMAQFLGDTEEEDI